MLPTTTTLSVWLIPSVIGAWYLCTAIHELGHAAIARFVGLRVVVCGIGFRRPLFRFRCCGIAFYLARPFAGGLTLFVPEQLQVPRKPMIAALGGGAGANCLTAFVTFGAWHLGVRNDLVMALFYFSCVFTLANAIPFTASCSGMKLPTDARQIIHFWRKTFAELEQPGILLVNCGALRDLCRDLGAPAGAAYFTLARALCQVQLSDPESACESLEDEVLSETHSDTAKHPLETLVRCAVAASDPDKGIEGVLRNALAELEDDPIAVANVQMLQAETALERKRSAVETARQAVEMARQTDLPYLESCAQALLIEVDPPDDFATACHRLLGARGPRKLTEMSALRLRCAAVGILVERGQTSDARSMWHEANSQLVEIAGTIKSDVTRERFLTRASMPLTRAMNALDDDVPLFIAAEMVTKAGTHSKPRKRRLWRVAIGGRWCLFLSGAFLGALLTCFILTRPGVYSRLARVVYRGLVYDGKTNRIPFSEQAMQVLHLARQEADNLGHEYVGVEHLLLAITNPGSRTTATRMLDDVNADAETVRSEISRLFPAGPNPRSKRKSRWLAQSQRMNAALSQAQREALHLSHDFVGPEHLLLGILHQTDTIAAKVLEDLNVDIARARDVLQQTQQMQDPDVGGTRG